MENRLTLIKIVGKNKWGNKVGLYRCECGGEKEITINDVKKGNNKSCGCLWRRHGLRNSRAYSIWCSMKSRCNNPNVPHFHRYGGRGIKVCLEWHTFECFYRDMGDPPPNHSLDRIDNDGSYEPSNCRWSSAKDQSRNTRRNRFTSVFGVTLTTAGWAEVLEVSASRIEGRLVRGWNDHDALLLPRNSKKPCYGSSSKLIEVE